MVTTPTEATIRAAIVRVTCDGSVQSAGARRLGRAVLQERGVEAAVTSLEYGVCEWFFIVR